MDYGLAKAMLHILIRHQKMDFESVLQEMKFKKVKGKTILDGIPVLKEKFNRESIKKDSTDQLNWVMGQLRKRALGNIDLSELSKEIQKT